MSLEELKAAALVYAAAAKRYEAANEAAAASKLDGRNVPRVVGAERQSAAADLSAAERRMDLAAIAYAAAARGTTTTSPEEGKQRMSTTEEKSTITAEEARWRAYDAELAELQAERQRTGRMLSKAMASIDDSRAAFWRASFVAVLGGCVERAHKSGHPAAMAMKEAAELARLAELEVLANDAFDGDAPDQEPPPVK